MVIRESYVPFSLESKGFKSWDGNWRPGSQELFNDFSFWHVKNPEAVLLNGSAVDLELRGPYSYTKRVKKLNVTWNADQSKATYRQYQWWTLNETTTGAHLNPKEDKMTLVNTALMGVYGQLVTGADTDDEWWQMLAWDLVATYTNASLFIELTPDQALFGYTDPTLEVVSKIMPNINPVVALNANMTSEKEALTPGVKDYWGQWTGADDLRRLQDVFRFREWEDYLPYWGAPWANRIVGHQAPQISPSWRNSVGSKQRFFLNQVARSINMTATEEVDLEGIPLLRFKPDPSNFLTSNCADNAECRPENAAFYMYGPSGLANMTAVNKLPLFIGAGAFYLANASYLEHLNGVTPGPEYEIYLDYDPISGLLLRAHTGLQVSLHLRAFPELLLFPNVPELYCPVFYSLQHAEAAPSQVQQWKTMVGWLPTTALVARWTFVALAAVCSLLSLCCFGQYFRTPAPKKSGYESISSVINY